MEVDIDQIQELMQAMAAHEIGHLEVHQGEESIVLKRQGAGAAAQPMPMVHGGMAPSTFPSAPPPPAQVEEPAGEIITSPFVGTFYRAPNPTSPAFTDKGKDFTKGQSLCIIEAMKLMNEIEAEFDGTCLEVLVENGKPVEYGDPLFRVEKR